MANIKSVIESTYGNRSDVEVTVDDNGVIHLLVWDPKGRDERALGNTFSPKNMAVGSELTYDSIEDAIAQVDSEILMAPALRSWIF